MNQTPKEQEEAKIRIINASIRLFSEKGFDGTSVSEIAKVAGVNKALIYYYFEGKESILDFLLNQVLEGFTTYSIDFVHEHILAMISEGKLEIEDDSFKFADEESADLFLNNINHYYEYTVNYMLDRRQIFRILMVESLKSSNHKRDLFTFLNLFEQDTDNLIYKTLKDADYHLPFSDHYLIHKLFFTLMPIINFATYFDDISEHFHIMQEELTASFLKICQLMIKALISGSEILLNNEYPVLARKAQ